MSNVEKQRLKTNLLQTAELLFLFLFVRFNRNVMNRLKHKIIAKASRMRRFSSSTDRFIFQGHLSSFSYTYLNESIPPSDLSSRAD